MRLRISYRLAVAAVLFGLYAIGIFWGLPSEFSPAIDSQTPQKIIHFFGLYNEYGEEAKYPAFHTLLSGLLYGAILLLMKVGGTFNPADFMVARPYGFGEPTDAFTILFVISRLLSVAMAVGVILTLCRIRLRGIRVNAGGRFVAVALLALSGEFAYYARTTNLDVPYLFWFALSFLFWWAYFFGGEGPLWYLRLAAITAALSMATKDQVFALLAGMCLAIILINPDVEALNWKQRLRRASYFGALVFLVYAVVAILIPHPARWWRHLTLWTLDAPGVRYFIDYDNTLAGHLGLLKATLVDLVNVMSLGGLLFALLGLAVVWRRRHYKSVIAGLLPIFSYYMLVIFNIRFVYERFMLPVAFILTIFGGLGFSLLLERVRQRAWLARAAGAALLAIILLNQTLNSFLPYTYIQTFDTKRQLAGDLASYVRPGETIIWDGEHVNFPNAGVYQQYQLMLPGDDPPYMLLRPAFKGLLVRYDRSRVRYVLSAWPLPADSVYGELHLVHRWGYPEWVNERVHVRVRHEYYLYRIGDTDLASP